MAGRSIEQPILIVCEGPSDCSLIEHLIVDYSIKGIQILSPKRVNAGDGFNAIPKTLKLLSQAGQLKQLRGLALVLDANGNPTQRFTEAAAALASVDFTVTEPFKIEPGIPTAAVYLFPEAGRGGCLEDLLLDVIELSDPKLITAVDAFAFAVGKPKSWPANKRAKMRVHALIAACCEEDPASSLNWVWRKIGNPMPLSSPKFFNLIKFLRDLEAVAANAAIAAALSWA